MFRSVRDGGDKGEFVAAGLRTPFVQFMVWSLLDLHKKKTGLLYTAHGNVSTLEMCVRIFRGVRLNGEISFNLE